jgi:hypothetical protein
MEVTPETCVPPDNELFRKSGNLSNQWNQGIVDFTGAQNMKVSIFCVFFPTPTCRIYKTAKKGKKSNTCLLHLLLSWLSD